MNKVLAVIASVLFSVLARVLADVLQTELNTVLLFLLIGQSCALFAELQDRDKDKFHGQRKPNDALRRRLARLGITRTVDGKEFGEVE